MSGLASAAAADLSLTGTNYTLVIVVAAIAVIALVMGAFFRRQVLAADPGTEKMQEIGAAVEEGPRPTWPGSSRRSASSSSSSSVCCPSPGRHRRRALGRSGFFVVGALSPRPSATSA